MTEKGRTHMSTSMGLRVKTSPHNIEHGFKKNKNGSRPFQSRLGSVDLKNSEESDPFFGIPSGVTNMIGLDDPTISKTFANNERYNKKSPFTSLEKSQPVMFHRNN